MSLPQSHLRGNPLQELFLALLPLDYNPPLLLPPPGRIMLLLRAERKTGPLDGLLKVHKRGILHRAFPRYPAAFCPFQRSIEITGIEYSLTFHPSYGMMVNL